VGKQMTLAYRARYSASGDQQQARFDQCIEVLNNERPHEALDMKCPAEVYIPSTTKRSWSPVAVASARPRTCHLIVGFGRRQMQAPSPRRR
jgi:hypothetical protein